MIRLLDQETIGQIAAGEVIERPVSVVKEMVENALDAGARRIAVHVGTGGLEFVEVIDDGNGIASEELPLALRRHATSKLAAAGDLFDVRTLGFRGEGLASIAAVAKVRVVSRTAASDVAAAIEAQGETVGEPEPAAGPPGTRVTVRDLFFNVPVRREYVRSPAAEFARIATWLSTLALAYPEVAFRLTHDGKETFAFSASGDIAERLAHVFGKSASRALVALDRFSTGMHGDVRGYVSLPGNDRPDRRMQVLFVNGRLLRSTILAGAWTAAYATFAMSGRHPYGVLFVSLPPEHVDANVHPTKSDVRLRYGVQVADAVKRVIRTTLTRGAAESARATFSWPPAAVTNGSPPLSLGFDDASEGDRAGAWPRIRVLAQIDATYIIATDGNALLLVDQHAAHERVAYETIARRNGSAAEREPLLIPFVVEVAPEHGQTLARASALLHEAGLEIEPFGERTYRITATPANYRARAFDVLGFLEEFSAEPRALDSRERVWASLACHSVVRAGETLELAEMTALLGRLLECENPMHCPHGRPTYVRLEPDALARLFKRS